MTKIHKVIYSFIPAYKETTRHCCSRHQRCSREQKFPTSTLMELGREKWSYANGGRKQHMMKESKLPRIIEAKMFGIPGVFRRLHSGGC